MLNLAMRMTMAQTWGKGRLTPVTIHHRVQEVAAEVQQVVLHAWRLSKLVPRTIA